MKDWVLSRVTERSTWVGVAALLSVLGFQVDDSTVQLLSQFVMAGAGLVAVFMKDKKL
jgi:hypothetical protein